MQLTLLVGSQIAYGARIAMVAVERLAPGDVGAFTIAKYGVAVVEGAGIERS